MRKIVIIVRNCYVEEFRRVFVPVLIRKAKKNLEINDFFLFFLTKFDFLKKKFKIQISLLKKIKFLISMQLLENPNPMNSYYPDSSLDFPQRESQYLFHISRQNDMINVFISFFK